MSRQHSASHLPFALELTIKGRSLKILSEGEQTFSETERSPSRRLFIHRLAFHLVLASVSLLLLSPFDQTLSLYLSQAHYLPLSIVHFMNQSVFEGQGLGASDLPVFVQMVCLGLWLFSKSQGRVMKRLTFLNLNGLFLAINVHLIKGLAARPRPTDVFNHGAGFVPFYRSWTFDGWGHGSFPSGHTASMMGLIAIAYLVPRGRGPLICLLVALSLLMAYARIAVQAHWPSDTLASLLLAWGTCDLLFLASFPSSSSVDAKNSASQLILNRDAGKRTRQR